MVKQSIRIRAEPDSAQKVERFLRAFGVKGFWVKGFFDAF